MARYFFQLEDRGVVVLRDEEGEEFGHIEGIRRHARQVALELWRNQPDHLVAHQRLLAINAAGLTSYCVPFRDTGILELLGRV
jgi:uncharacterized protein DUF6894